MSTTATSDPSTFRPAGLLSEPGDFFYQTARRVATASSRRMVQAGEQGPACAEAFHNCRSAVRKHAAARRHSLSPAVLPAEIAWSRDAQLGDLALSRRAGAEPTPRSERTRRHRLPWTLLTSSTESGKQEVRALAGTLNAVWDGQFEGTPYLPLYAYRIGAVGSPDARGALRSALGRLISHRPLAGNVERLRCRRRCGSAGPRVVRLRRTT